MVSLGGLIQMPNVGGKAAPKASDGAKRNEP